MRTRYALTFLCLLTAPTLAQDIPDRVNIGEGHMTVGFELKTTDKGDGPNGRTRNHALMRYVIPTGSSWTPEQQRTVDRWGSLSLQQRTAFFFETYAGGYYASNFKVDTERYPHLEPRVSWYGSSLGIPHIEIRSEPFDSPRAAYRAMQELRRTVPETIAFHVHMRFPDTGIAGEKAAEAAEWLRRASWSIWLRRAHVSSQTAFVLKQADNQPVNRREVEQLEERLRSGRMGELLGRRGLRVNRMNGPNGPLIDVELRGLMKDLPSMRRFLAETGRAFGEGEFGSPERGRSPFADERGIDQPALSRTSTWSQQNLAALGEAFTEALERHGVSTRLSAEQARTAVAHLAQADTVAGRRTLLPSSFDWLFLPIEHDGALPEGVQEQIETQKRTYLRKLAKLAERVHRGEFGEPGSERYRALSVASRTRRVLHDFVNVKYEDAGRRAKLHEWYETSLFQPEETRARTERWRAETGNNRAEAYRQVQIARGQAAYQEATSGLPRPSATSTVDSADRRHMAEAARLRGLAERAEAERGRAPSAIERAASERAGASERAPVTRSYERTTSSRGPGSLGISELLGNRIRSATRRGTERDRPRR